MKRALSEYVSMATVFVLEQFCIIDTKLKSTFLENDQLLEGGLSVKDINKNYPSG